MKKYTLIIMVFLAAITAGSSYFLGKKSCVPCVEASKTDTSYRVAIILPVSHAALEEIKQGFVDTMNREIKTHVDVYNAQGDRILLRTQAEQIVSKSYNLVFAIATQPAIVMKEVALQRNSAIPIVAGAVDDPVKNQLIFSMQSSGNNVVAVTSDLGDIFLENYVSIIIFLIPSIKRVLLPYTTTPGIEKDKDILVSLLQKQGINVTLLPISNIQDMLHKVPLMISGHDGVFVLRDNNVVSGIEALSALCNRHKIILFAHDLNSVEKGAAIGYGVREYDFGVESAHRAIRILQKGEKPTDIESGTVGNLRLKLNRDNMENQGFLLDHALLLALTNSEIIMGAGHV